MKVSRRQFLKIGAGAAIISALQPSLLLAKTKPGTIHGKDARLMIGRRPGLLISQELIDDALIGSSGGFLVPMEYRAALMEAMREDRIIRMRPRCIRLPW